MLCFLLIAALALLAEHDTQADCDQGGCTWCQLGAGDGLCAIDFRADLVPRLFIPLLTAVVNTPSTPPRGIPPIRGPPSVSL
jgi:hypothetical protein